jgi:hypothetical protein
MKYQAPELTTLTPAIRAIQGSVSKSSSMPFDSIQDHRESASTYVDWE